MQGTARGGRGLRVHRVDQGLVATVMGSDGDGGLGSGLLWGRRTVGSGHGSHRCATGLRSRNSGRGGEQVTGAARPGHGKGSE